MKRNSRKKSQGGIGRVIIPIFIFCAGLIAGYLVRSYRPLPIPMESPLVADKSSEQVADSSLKALVRATTDRAEKAEGERDQLKQELADLTADRARTQQELADLKIKSVLTATNQ